jgi:hypothetical protein
MDTLKIDIDIRDFEKVRSIIKNRCSVFKILGDVKPVGVIVRSTAKGYHLYLDVVSEKPLDSFALCFLQMALGSDYKRETFNYMRFRQSLSKDWNVLFMRKYDGNGVLLSMEKDEPALSSLLWASINERMGMA